MNTMHDRAACSIAIALFLGTTLAASAQEPAPLPTLPSPVATDSTASNDARTVTVDHGNGMRIAKWSVLAVSSGAAIYGFVSNRSADDRYDRLEQTCVEEPDRCLTAPPEGPYSDPTLEAEYQDVRSMDRRARTALLASQIGVATAVVLFILDLRNSDTPDNIPYEPRSFEIGPSRDGGLSMSWQLKLH